MHVIAGLEIPVLSALRGLHIDARWTFSFCFFRHRARLLRRHPERARTAACSRARAAVVVAEVCQTVKRRRARLRMCSKKHETLLSEGGATKTAASSNFSISLNYKDYELGKTSVQSPFCWGCFP